MTPIFIILIAIWAAAYVVGYLRRVPDAEGDLRIPLWTKLVMIGVTLAVAGILVGQDFPNIATAAILLILGLLFGAIGDLILANVFPLKHPELAAMGAFGIGHGFYIVTILALSSALARMPFIQIMITLGISLIAGAALWRVLVYNPTGKSSLNTGSLIYGLVLVSVVGLAINLWLQTGSFALLAVGIILFAISDVILAQSLIRKQGTPFLRDIVWIIYSGGQMLIAFSVAAFN